MYKTTYKSTMYKGTFSLLTILAILAASLVTMFGASPLRAASKETALKSEPVRQPLPKQLTVRKVSGSQAQIANQNTTYTPGAPLLSLAAGAPCIADLSGDPAWLISGWIIGQEIYKAYQDPELVCPAAYPFTINEAHILLQVIPDAGLLPLDIPMSADIELVDTTTEPGCTRPGTQIFQGSPGIVTITEAGIWDISIPLDFPIEVTGPYFVGVSFDEVVTQAMGIRLITDAIETFCVSFNKWDEEIGFIDLGNDRVVYTHAFPPSSPCFDAEPNDPNCFSFDGRLVMWTEGVTGGVVTPDLAVDFLGPQASDVLYSTVDIWVIESSGLGITDSAVFYWGSGNTRNRIGVDNNGIIAPPSAGTPGPGRGFSYYWDFSGITEQSAYIKVELYDTLSRSVADSVLVVLDPTPPVPARTTPSYFSKFCAPITASYNLVDEENLLSWAAIRKPAEMEHRKTLGTFNQFLLGDNNGNPNDGNSAANGELGDFYGGPAVGALALEYWFNQGFVQSMLIGGTKLTKQQAADMLGDFMLIPDNGGLEDDRFVFGFRSYLAVTGFGEQKLDFTRDASYATLRNWAEEIGGVIMIAVDGLPGRWLAVDGFSGLPSAEGAFRVVVSDPWDAATKTIFWRDTQSGSEVLIDGVWKTVGLMTRLLPATWSPADRTTFDLNVIPTSPFNLLLDGSAQNLVDGDLYFFTLEMTDFDGNVGDETVLLRYICSAFGFGDYDGNGPANIGDLVYLINFQVFGGPAPVGGAGRADANCSGGIDTADLVYYSNWLFAGGPAPCQ